MDCSLGAPRPLSVGINLAETPWVTPTWSQSERSMIPNEFRLWWFTWFRCPIQLTCFTWFTHGWHTPGAPPGGQVSDISNGGHTTHHRLSTRFYRFSLLLADVYWYSVDLHSCPLIPYWFFDDTHTYFMIFYSFCRYSWTPDGFPKCSLHNVLSFIDFPGCSLHWLPLMLDWCPLTSIDFQGFQFLSFDSL